MAETSKPLSSFKQSYGRKGKTQLGRQMSLLIAKCTWNFPPNLQWLKAKMTILHLPPKLNNLLLVKKKESVCIKGQYSARYCETEERIKQNERQYWCMILSPLKNIIPE